ncbi:similar to Saccharomyces cerevisiae YKL006C-A SFT1 Intra-Golgi v-SNARE, required for transport of proteins between an early and a later Golgi compartment [Geotrichum candidum]|uniref:Similar to Saccharomyces cerevisiae YKL006C-A SFT1 Intra-Golgi v-SNARE, required for transport of proteins between an early and a later Golgi compartment n=1 Tax=Geotrichum candidum TaxID=1173061 RepID=A0A0J9X505_GEOCN|nr:similar to Saccharomyces cerevisiae YKL006C-A SFT1 Intra-Golgi v-SNARE, required for transport of proteins between an early and a later Golgi compartment [Geotrichum candidum]
MASSASQSYQREEQNDRRLQELSTKISLLRNVTNDIYAEAQDQSYIDSAQESMNKLFTSVKTSSGRLLRSAKAGHPVFKTAGLAIFIILLLYFVYKAF